MADLTEDDVTVLDGLLQFYLDLVYLPECENAYREFQNARTRQALHDQAQLGPLDRALFDPDHPPEIVKLLSIDGTRKQFVDTYLTDDWVRVLVPLFERADLRWDAALAKEKGRLAAFRKTIQQWSGEEWNAALPDPAGIKWDPDIADVLPSGDGFIGPQSRFDAAVRSATVARAMQTLANIASGPGGTLGYLRDGDEGSDRGALAEAFLPGGGRGGGRAGRARRRNKGRKSTSYKGTGSTATGSRATGSRGTEAPITAPRRRAPSKRTQISPPKRSPAATPPPPPEQPKRRTSEQRAIDRAASAQAAAAGKKLTPKVEAKLASGNVDVKDEFTRERLNEIFTVNRSDDADLRIARANSGELRGMMREGKYPGVKKVRFLRPVQGKGERTPDIEVILSNGSKKFVEVRTVTGAMRGATVKDAKSVSAPISAEFIKSVEGKLHHGQISEKNPGKILFHAPRQAITSTALEGWREMLGMIRKNRGPLPKGLERIEVTGAPENGGRTNMLVFVGPKWQGLLVK